MRQRSRSEIYLHFVWTTKWRADALTPEFERRIHRCIYARATEAGCAVLALGGMPDHIHLVVRQSPTISASELMNDVKGASSRLYNSLRPEFSERFDWQDGYACFSIGRDLVPRVKAYVLGQKEHHAAGSIWPAWEETGESRKNAERIVSDKDENGDTEQGESSGPVSAPENLTSG